MSTYLVLAISSLFLALNTSAAFAQSEDKLNPQHAVVEELLVNNDTKRLIGLIAKKLAYEILESVRNSSSVEPSDDFIKLLDHLTKTAVYEDFVVDKQFEKIFYELYDEYFTLEELQAILAFQTSEAGKKMKQYMPHVEERSFQIAKEKAALTDQKIHKRLMEQLDKAEEKINESGK